VNRLRDEVVERLRVQFGTLPATLVEDVVEQAEEELRGQAMPGAMAELLYRLAACRLAESGESVR
jgi:hypothetical protein